MYSITSQDITKVALLLQEWNSVWLKLNHEKQYTATCVYFYTCPFCAIHIYCYLQELKKQKTGHTAWNDGPADQALYAKHLQRFQIWLNLGSTFQTRVKNLHTLLLN